MAATTLAEKLEERLRAEPEAVACHLVAGDGSATPVTVRALIERAMSFAAMYGPPSDRTTRKTVGVCLYHGLDLHAAFLGGLWAGHIPTMLAPPSPRMEPSKYTRSFAQMLEHVQPAWLVVDAATHAKLDPSALGGFPESHLVVAELVRDAHDGALQPWHGARPDDVALVQHSSGTTGLQKGMALSHAAVLEHNRRYAAHLGIGRDDVIVSWLPLYHDMGFVACFLLPLLEGIPFVEISPFDWVARPALLLEQIQARRGTLCWLPNFAFAYMAQSVREGQLADDVDLSSIRAWINCSEPVTHASMTAFMDRFRRHGARPEQLTASYAMAENVYAVTQSLPGRYRTVRAERGTFLHQRRIEVRDDPSGDALLFVSNGPVMHGTELVVLDDTGGRLPDGTVGELALRGVHRFSGYFGRDDLTQQAMTPDGWYKTGDLGFVWDGHVYVTGRKKDLIIVQGRNFYPTDIERIAGEVGGVNPGRVVAFGIADERAGTEGIVVLAEPLDSYEGDPRKLALEIRKSVAQQLDCTPADVRIVQTRWLVKSTSGKLARNDNRIKYLAELKSTPAHAREHV